MFKPVQRRLSRQHSAIGAARFSLARDKAQHGIMAQFIVIVEVFIAKRDAMNALGEQRFDRVLDAVLPAAICEQAATCRDRPRTRSASRNNNAPAFEVMAPPSKAAVTFRLPKLAKSRESRATLCLHRGCPLL